MMNRREALQWLSAAALGTMARSAVACPGCRPQVPTLARNNNRFATDLYARLSRKSGNLFFSPYSISTALAMTYAGARGRTARQMAETLQFQGDTVHADFHKLIGQVSAGHQEHGNQLDIANALWGQRGYHFLKEFLSLVERSYGAGLREVDFVRATEAARRTINAWVARKTQDMIPELLKPGLLGPLTRLVLTNAVYFKGAWQYAFDKRGTVNADFWLSAKDKTTVPMMYQVRQFGYHEDDTCRVLEMPYVGDRLSMVALLPKKRDGLAQLERSLTASQLTHWLGKLREREVRVTLPRFKLGAEFRLEDVLPAMGMPDAFTGAADFSGMNGRRDLRISAVVHEAKVDVAEKGTVASAATAVVMDRASLPIPQPTVVANHPFVFMIREKSTGSLLFLGRVANPGA